MQKILDTAALRPGDHVLEVGPGRGALTFPLLEAGAVVHAVEIDRDLARGLQKTPHPNLHVHREDILKFDFAALPPAGRWRVLGNLPYNISTPLLFRLFDCPLAAEDFHFMVQLEVARRLCARAGDGDYGRLSVMAQFYCGETALLFEVGRGAFRPPPRVTSALVRLRRHARAPAPAEAEKFGELVRAAFCFPRKTLRHCLASHYGERHVGMLAQSGVDGALRAEKLSAHDFKRLAAEA